MFYKQLYEHQNRNITLVTAFFDLSRTSWPFYARDSEEYWCAFERICSLSNKAIVFLDSQSYSRASDIVAKYPGKIFLEEFNPLCGYWEFTSRAISQVQADHFFRSRVQDLRSPEYWNSEYVLVNYLKSFLCMSAVNKYKLYDSQVAWIDFGYLRTAASVPETGTWSFAFPKDRITLFAMRPWVDGVDISQVVYSGATFFQGGCIIATGALWQYLAVNVTKSLFELLSKNLVDDDQTLLLCSYLRQPNLFNVVYINMLKSSYGWFHALKTVNMNKSTLRRAFVPNEIQFEHSGYQNLGQVPQSLINIASHKYLGSSFEFDAVSYYVPIGNPQMSLWTLLAMLNSIDSYTCVLIDCADAQFIIANLITNNVFMLIDVAYILFRDRAECASTAFLEWQHAFARYGSCIIPIYPE